MATYNCVHSGDQYRITKFSPDGNVESSYLCDHVACECPAGPRPTCRHRQMLPAFLDLNLVNSYLFLDWDNGRRIVDFNGLPATVQSLVDPVWEFSEDDCPGHVAYSDNPKLCGRCGVHIDSLRPDDLAPQALTDTGAQPDEPTANVPTSEQLYNRQVMKAGGSITTNYMQDGSVETYATLPHEPVPPAADVTSGEPAKPANSWRRW